MDIGEDLNHLVSINHSEKNEINSQFDFPSDFLFVAGFYFVMLAPLTTEKSTFPHLEMNPNHKF